MPDLSFHVREITQPNIDLDPNDHFTVVSVDGGDFVVPHDPSSIHSFQFGLVEGEEGLNLFIYLDEKPFGATILYNDIDQRW